MPALYEHLQYLEDSLYDASQVGCPFLILNESAAEIRRWLAKWCVDHNCQYTEILDPTDKNASHQICVSFPKRGLDDEDDDDDNDDDNDDDENDQIQVIT